ncbi:exocyst complex component 3-like protein 2 [Protopterus annectens]|uniref:exocyst complex component 3-like protein 2 n=1 Tax=Protopterus annectens TaxID=7888 RepID=UPI001CF97FC8|nr:exocyst complex component 3-like protein 2 [Protopterus annectens]XP_043918552.1 exocyst complex component 3-like protein 2 [Protopterus annectens]
MKMPVLKNGPTTLKTARVNGELKQSREVIMDSLIEESNPFHDSMDESESNPFHESICLNDRNPFVHDENGINEELLNGSLEGHPRKYGTLERLAGLSPLKMLNKGKKVFGREKVPNGDKNVDRKSFFGSLSRKSFLFEDDGSLKSSEKKKTRRSSEDFSLLLKFNSKRKESLTSLDSTTSERDLGDSDSKKRLSFLKLPRTGKGKRESVAERTEPETVEDVKDIETVVKVKEPLSVLEIQNLILCRDLVMADKHMIELEEECGVNTQKSPNGSDECRHDDERKAKDVCLLYQSLSKELWSVVKESLSNAKPYPALELVVQVIEQEEETDKMYLARVKDSGHCMPIARPRQFKTKWVEAVNGSVNERLNLCNDEKNGPINSYMDKLRKRIIEDMNNVKTYIVKYYPKDYNVYHVYVKSYHQGISSRFMEITSRTLEINDLYVVLDWHNNIYSREVLRHLALDPLMGIKEIDPLLPRTVADNLEENCFFMVQEIITEDMKQELDKEEQRWKGSSTIEEFESIFPTKVIKTLRTHVDKAVSIAKPLGMKIALGCLSSLTDFLQWYQKKVELLHESLREESDITSDMSVAKIITTVNCCPPFRDYVEHLASFNPTQSEELRKCATASLDKVVNLGNQELISQLFEDLKPLFNKLMRRKWLNSYDACNEMKSTIKDHFDRFRKMKKIPYQNLVNEIHRKFIIEYIKPLVEVRIICSSSKMRKKISNKLIEESKQFKVLFGSLETTSAWLNPAIPHLAEIIMLKDTASIQMEVGVLIRDFPDVHKKHVSAVLDVRGETDQAVRQEILNIIKDYEHSGSQSDLSRDRALFADIPRTNEVRCINVYSNRVYQSLLNCFSVAFRRCRIHHGDGIDEDLL